MAERNHASELKRLSRIVCREEYGEAPRRTDMFRQCGDRLTARRLLETRIILDRGTSPTKLVDWLRSTGGPHLQYGVSSKHRVLVAGHPGSGKSSIAELVSDLVARRQIRGFESEIREHREWCLPLLARGIDIYRAGLVPTLTRVFRDICRENVSPGVLRAAIQQGHIVPIIDGLEDWADDGCLSSATPLVAEFLTLVGHTGRFLATIDTQLVVFSLFGDPKRKRLGERFADAEDMTLISLLPDGRLEAGDAADSFLDFRNSLAFVNSEPRSAGNYEKTIQGYVRAWEKGDDLWGTFRDRHRQSFMLELTKRILASGINATPLEQVYSIVFDILDEGYRQTFYIEQIVDAVHESGIFAVSEEQGVRFTSRAIYEAMVVEWLAKLASDTRQIDSLWTALKLGLATERLGCHFWVHPEIASRREQVAQRLHRHLEGYSARGTPGRNLACNLTVLLMTHHRLFKGTQSIVDLPERVILRDCDLEERDFSGARLARWDFSASVLTNSQFCDVEMKDCAFEGVVAPSVEIRARTSLGTNLFSEARLPGALMILGDLKHWRFTKADLTASAIEAEGDKETTKLAFQHASLSNAKLATNLTAALADLPRLAVRDLDIVINNVRSSSSTYYFGQRYKVLVAEPMNHSTADLEIIDLAGDEVTWKIECSHSVERVRYLGGMERHFIVAEGREQRTFVCVGENGTQHTWVCRTDEVWDAAVAKRDCVLLATPRGLEVLTFSPDSATRVVAPDVCSRVLGHPESDSVIAVSGALLTVLSWDADKLVAGESFVLQSSDMEHLELKSSEIAFSYGDRSVELVSRRFGWTSRSRHLLSFETISGLFFSSDQPLLFVIGNWRGEPDGSAVALIDTRSGALLLYFPVEDAVCDEESLTTLVREQAHNLRIGLAAEEERADISAGVVSLGDHSVMGVLSNMVIEWKTERVPRGEETEIGFDLRPAVSSEGSAMPGRLFKSYRVVGERRETPLDIEVRLTRPDGSFLLLEGNRFEVCENTTEGSLECRGTVTLEQVGDYRAKVTAYLCGRARGLLVERPLAVREKNPYTYGHEIKAHWRHMFTGNSQILNWVMENFRNSNLAILGSRRQGKSSLLWELWARLRIEEARDVLPVVISFEGMGGADTFQVFVAKVLSALLADQEARRLLEYDELPPVESSSEALNEIANLRRRLTDALGPGSYLVVLADEVERFVEWDPNLSDALRSTYHTNPWLRQVAACLPTFHRCRGSWERSGFSTLLHHARYMQPLQPGEMCRLIEEPISGQYEIDPETIELVLKYASGRPHDLQVLMFESVNAAREMNVKRITSPMVTSALQRTLLPIYREYLTPFVEFQTEYPKEAGKIRRLLEENFEPQYECLNTEKASPAFFRPFCDWGYVKGTTGEFLHIPYALVKAWVELS